MTSDEKIQQVRELVLMELKEERPPLDPNDFYETVPHSILVKIVQILEPLETPKTSP